MASSNSFSIVTTNNTVVMKYILQLQAITYVMLPLIQFPELTEFEILMYFVY